VQPAIAETGRSIALVLDASGSMNAQLPEGTTRIDAAKAAVRQQLQCIANVARGSYFYAAGANELTDALGKAAEAKAAGHPLRKSRSSSPPRNSAN
jgi:hypothetical protein